MRKIAYQMDSKEVQELIKQDSKLNPLFQSVKSVSINLEDNYLSMLYQTIIGQRLSIKVAQVIIKRFLNLCGDIDPNRILLISDADYQAIGLSSSKIKYIKHLSLMVLDGHVHFDKIESMDNQEIYDMLIQVKGIGPWTIEMFLMFSLGREDVFSIGDLGLKRAVETLYGKKMTMDELIVVSQKWKPYRSIVSHFLWHMHDQNGLI